MKKKYKCNYCGREFHARIAHKCNGTFRKKRLNWTELTPKIKESKTMKNKEKQEIPEFQLGDYVSTRDGKVGIVINNGEIWCFSPRHTCCPFDRLAIPEQIRAMDYHLRQAGKYLNKATYTIEDIESVDDTKRSIEIDVNIPDGKELTIEEIYELFDAIDETAKEVKQSIIHDVFPDDVTFDKEMIKEIMAGCDGYYGKHTKPSLLVAIEPMSEETGEKLSEAITRLQALKFKQSDAPKSVLLEAHAIVNGERQVDYGDKREGFEHISKIASSLTGKALTPIDCCKVLMAVKLSREGYRHKRDNLVDLCGYAEILNILENHIEECGK